MSKYTVYVEDVLGNKIADNIRSLKPLFVNSLIHVRYIWMTKSDVTCGVVQLIGDIHVRLTP
jgi:hypothetical protein